MRQTVFIVLAASVALASAGVPRNLKQDQTQQGYDIQSLLSKLGISPDAFTLGSGSSNGTLNQFEQWWKSVSTTAQNQLQHYPLARDMLSGLANQSQAVSNILQALHINPDVNRTAFNGDRVFNRQFLDSLRANNTLFSGQPLNGTIIHQVQSAIDGAGGPNSTVGSFLSNLFGTAAGDQTMFQSASNLRQSDLNMFNQALNSVRSANGGTLPALDKAFVDQVMKFLDGMLSGANGNMSNYLG